MPPPLTKHSRRSLRFLLGLALGASALALLAVPLTPGCSMRHGEIVGDQSGVYPPAPQPPRIIALGSLRGSRPPTETEIEVSRFLFGEEPAAPLAIANPTGIYADGPRIWICDNTLDVVLCWNGEDGTLGSIWRNAPVNHVFAIDAAPDGSWVVCDRGGAAHLTADGKLLRRYQPPDTERKSKATGVLIVDRHVWVANQSAHAVDVFELETGAYVRRIGGHGLQHEEFVMPRGMARTPDGSVCVVDMINNRVQVLGPAGDHRLSIGQAGDNVGSFGRPRDVAVGPDGTVFVTDAFSQRVHAFAPDGTPLLGFGEPHSGVGALTLPNGIAITTVLPRTDEALPANVEPDYYILVAEQLDEPGVRVYAWLGRKSVEPTNVAPLRPRSRWQPPSPEIAAINPHWHPDLCTECHREQGGKVLPIPIGETDALCLSCHDGVKAPADPHPIGRPANSEQIKTPADWPTIDGAIGCMTCHGMEGHCRKEDPQPGANPRLLRGFDPRQPLAYCTICHQPDVGQRFSPHRQRDASGRIRQDACLFCHTGRPEIPEDGRRQFSPQLRNETSDVCLNCHSPHWDLSPEGHVDRPVTPRIREWMLAREFARTRPNASDDELRAMARQSTRDPARLPLSDGLVTCYSCHNPHYNGLFPLDSELGAMATNPQDRKSALRADWIDLCSECHNR